MNFLMLRKIKVGSVVKHNSIRYLNKGTVVELVKYNGVIVDWSGKSGVLFRRHRISSLSLHKDSLNEEAEKNK